MATNSHRARETADLLARTRARVCVCGHNRDPQYDYRQAARGNRGERLTEALLTPKPRDIAKAQSQWRTLVGQ